MPNETKVAIPNDRFEAPVSFAVRQVRDLFQESSSGSRPLAVAVIS